VNEFTGKDEEMIANPEYEVEIYKCVCLDERKIRNETEEYGTTAT